MRPSEEEMESKGNPIVSYIVSPYYMYNKSKYPQFLSGSGIFHFIRSNLYLFLSLNAGTNYLSILLFNIFLILGYIFSRSSFPCLYAAALTLPYFHIEDVFMTGFVAEKCKFRRKNIPSFYPAIIDHTQVSPEDTFLHYITPEEKYRIHSVVMYQHFFANDPNLK